MALICPADLIYTQYKEDIWGTRGELLGLSSWRSSGQKPLFLSDTHVDFAMGSPPGKEGCTLVGFSVAMGQGV